MSATRTRRTARTTTHLTRRGRLVLVLALAGLLYAAFSVGRAGTQASTVAEPLSAPAPVAASVAPQVTVQSGETLWTVAQRIAPDDDPRGVVQQIKRLNDLADGGVRAGQQLLLPV